MKKSVLMFSLLSGTALMFPRLTIASGLPALTHTYTPEPKPAFQFEQPDKAYQTAAVCFLGAENCGDAGFGSMGGDDGYKVDTVQQCGNEGYSVTSCSLPAYPSGQCPYNSAYFAKCVEDRPRACKEAGFTETSCASGTVVEATCSFDANYKKCKCDPCSGYDYTYAQASAQGYVPDGSCLSCSETKYKRKENPCSGYSSCECGGETGSASCYSGSIQKFESCKKCDPCAGYYDCGGSWQYCEGSVCSADSSRCSTYCESDHFPYSCGSDYGPCYGDYRNGYCSVSCDKIETDPCAGTSCPSGVSCGSLGCASYSSSTSCCSSVCTSCNQEPDDPCAGVTGLSCGSLGCASYGSCGQCTECKANPDCNVTSMSCQYGCASTNSCGKCTECKGNPDCDVVSKSCKCACSQTNSCGKCVKCAFITSTPVYNSNGMYLYSKECQDYNAL